MTFVKDGIRNDYFLEWNNSELLGNGKIRAIGVGEEEPGRHQATETEDITAMVWLLWGKCFPKFFPLLVQSNLWAALNVSVT